MEAGFVPAADPILTKLRPSIRPRSRDPSSVTRGGENLWFSFLGPGVSDVCCLAEAWPAYPTSRKSGVSVIFRGEHASPLRSARDLHAYGLARGKLLATRAATSRISYSSFQTRIRSRDSAPFEICSFAAVIPNKFNWNSSVDLESFWKFIRRKFNEQEKKEKKRKTKNQADLDGLWEKEARERQPLK